MAIKKIIHDPSIIIELSGDGSGITGIASSSYSVTSSYALSSVGTAADWATITNKPSGLVSSSNQVSYTGLINIPVGIISSSGQVDFTGIINKPTLVSASSQISYTGLTNIPIGVVSSSTQAASWTVLSASYAAITSRSYTADSALSSNISTSSSYAATSSVIQSRNSIIYTTPSISNNTSYTSSINLGRAFLITDVQVDKASRVRLYLNTGSRFNDGLRGITIDPSSSAGVLLETLTTAGQTIMMAPPVWGVTNEPGSLSTGSTPCLIENRSGGAATIQVIVTYYGLQ